MSNLINNRAFDLQLIKPQWITNRIHLKYRIIVLHFQQFKNNFLLLLIMNSCLDFDLILWRDDEFQHFID